MAEQPKLPEPGACEDCLTVVAYLRATKDGVPIWGEDCVCQNPVYPSDPDGSDAGSISMPLVRLSDAQLLAAEVERLRAEVARLDWIVRQADEFSCGLIVDAPGDGDYIVHGMDGYGQGKTAREAIDNAMRFNGAALDASRLALKETT